MDDYTQNNPGMAGSAGADFADKIGQLKTLVEEICTAAPGAAKEQIAQLAEMGGQLAAVGKDKAYAAGKQVVDTVKKHPYETAAVAVGAGLLIWWLMNRNGGKQRAH